MPAYLDQAFFFFFLHLIVFKSVGEKKRKFEAEPGQQLYISSESHWLYYQQILMVSNIEGK